MKRLYACSVYACLYASSVLVGAALSACGDEVHLANDAVDAGTPDAARPIVDASTAIDAPVITPEASVDAGCPSCVVALAVNGDNSCAIMGDATVRCWGANEEGQLGFDAGANVATPTPVPGLGGVTSLAIGGFADGIGTGFMCATVAGGDARCWGLDGSGELGRGDAGASDPTPASIVHSAPITQISALDETACALDRSGNVACWGSNGLYEIVPTFAGEFSTPQPIIAATTFTQVSVGTDVCAVSVDKHVWCWGRPTFGDLGRAATDGGVQDFAPAEVTGLDDVSQVVTGTTSACALTTDGVAHCWGGSSHGTSLLGRGDVDSGTFDANPAAVVMPPGVTFRQLVGHENGYCALDTTGAVWCWGHNYEGADGISAPDGGELYPIWQPTKVPSLSDVTQIASGAGALHVCVLTGAGGVKCWGYNRSNQLGTADLDGSVLTSLTPIDVVF